MIESIKIRNFKGFKVAALEGLQRVNIIVGDNASGKTALGEALMLAAGGGTFAVGQMRLGRGRLFPQISQPSTFVWTRSLFEEFWDDLFYDRSERIEFSMQDTNADKVVVRVYYDRKAPSSQQQTPFPAEPVSPIVFERTRSTGTNTTRISLKNNQFDTTYEGDASGEFVPNIVPIGSAVVFDQQTGTSWFSDLVKTHDEEQIHSQIREIFPQVQDLAIALDATLPSLYAGLAHVGDRLPIGLVSSGVARLLYMLLAINSVPKGVVMIDELENGIYFANQSKIWKCLFDFSRKRDVQLFVSTHSWECLRAVQGLISEHKADFTLVRTVRDLDGTSALRHFKGENLAAALEQNVDIR
jgi:predicted ATPase